MRSDLQIKYFYWPVCQLLEPPKLNWLKTLPELLYVSHLFLPTIWDRNSRFDLVPTIANSKICFLDFIKFAQNTPQVGALTEGIQRFKSLWLRLLAFLEFVCNFRLTSSWLKWKNWMTRKNLMKSYHLSALTGYCNIKYQWENVYVMFSIAEWGWVKRGCFTFSILPMWRWEWQIEFFTSSYYLPLILLVIATKLFNVIKIDLCDGDECISCLWMK